MYCLYCQVIPKCSQWSKAKCNSGDNQWTCKTTTDQDTCIMKCSQVLYRRHNKCIQALATILTKKIICFGNCEIALKWWNKGKYFPLNSLSYHFSPFENENYHWFIISLQANNLTSLSLYATDLTSDKLSSPGFGWCHWRISRYHLSYRSCTFSKVKKGQDWKPLMSYCLNELLVVQVYRLTTYVPQNQT